MGEFALIIEADEEEVEAASVYVEGTIDEKKYRFLLDTGAARSSVIFDDYTSMFDRVGDSTSSGIFASVSDDLITVPQIEIGPISKRNFILARSTSVQNTTNIIGMDLLRDFRCHFLFNEQRITVDSDNTDEDVYTFEPLLLDAKFHPYIHVQFGTLQAKAVWDTGASITIADLNLINSHPTFFSEVGKSTGTDAVGSTLETPIFIMSSVIIGNYSFPPHRVAGVDLAKVNATLEIPMDLILGYSTWSKANWLFDFPGKRWIISKWLSFQ